MGMLHFTSGKSGYMYYGTSMPAVRIRIPREKLMEILKLEDTYRASREYQDMYSKKDDLAWFKEVTIEIQKRALLETGLEIENLQQGLDALWRARGDFHSDPAINQLTVYQRKDRSRAGSMFDGCLVPNVPLQTFDGTFTDLKTYCNSNFKNPDLPLFLISGSVS